MSDIHNEIFRKKTGGNQKVSDSRGGGSTQIPQANQIAYGQTNVASALDDNTGAIKAIVNVTGSKNLNSYPYSDGIAKTENGITYAVNNKGVITVSGQTGSSLTSSYTMHYSSVNPLYLMNGTYTLTGCPEGSTKIKSHIEWHDASNNTVYYEETGDGVTFTVNGSYGDTEGASVLLYIRVLTDADFTTPIKVYPQIQDARIKDPTFAPWAMTNRQLTESVTELNSNKAPLLSNSSTYHIIDQSVAQNNIYTCPASGMYILSLTALDGGALWYINTVLGDAPLLGNGMENTMTSAVPLKAGTRIRARAGSGTYKVDGYYDI